MQVWQEPKSLLAPLLLQITELAANIGPTYMYQVPTVFCTSEAAIGILDGDGLFCSGHDVKLHPSSATGNQQHPCAGPKPGQREKVCQMGDDTLAVKDQDD
jgi:hypothetical protein